MRGLKKRNSHAQWCHDLQSWCFGITLRHRVFWVSYKCGESSLPNLFIKAPTGRVFYRVAYEKIKIEASKDVEVRMNLSFAY